MNKTDMSMKQFRVKLQEQFGKRRYRITRDREIHAIHQNSDAPYNNFWAFMGYADEWLANPEQFL